ncbi:type VI secretion system tube protein TssD [Dysgonomonas sp. ZJ279]|uniref:type VI secretion system tube protein TssD n=1 Tax=Dysgonomonas sp. ZJ279 TaxID=2709796 RepID=UPI0013EDDD1C|nr:type VI secretion system tube protein TssD [Dysgonomonas sp. ZJ279]
MAFKAILKVDGEERTLLTYHNYLFDMWSCDFSKVTKTHSTLYDYMAVAKASPYAFIRYGEPFGGLFDFTIESTDDDDFFYHWFKSDDKKGRTYIKNGVIEIYNSRDEYMPMRRIEFWDAWITEISEHHIAYSNMPMILAFTISPATIRVNKRVVFQKNWFITDINQKDAQPQEKAEPVIKSIYWKGTKEGTERKDIMLNHSLLLEVEFREYMQGDSIELTVKQNKGRRIKAQAKEFSVSGTIDENGLMLIPNFKVECDFKDDNLNFGNIEFYYKDNKVGELKENFGWTYVKDKGILKIVANIELKTSFLPVGCLESDLKNAVSELFKSVLQKSSGGVVTGQLFFNGIKTVEMPQVVPALTFQKQNACNGCPTSLGQTIFNTSSVNVAEVDDSFLLTETSETGIHELLHTLRLDHPFEITQAQDTKLIYIGGNNLKTTASTDPNIFYNVMNYDSNIIDGQNLGVLWKIKRPEYLTKGQIQHIFREIDLQQKGGGTKSPIATYDDTSFDDYWITNIPGERFI